MGEEIPLVCAHCGQEFLVPDREQIRIEHFEDCPGTDP